MSKISLRPYPGSVKVCATTKEYRKEYKRMFGKNISMRGRCGRADSDINSNYIVWAVDQPRLAHELAHVIFCTFHNCGMDARHDDGEAFCYMLSQLLLDSRLTIRN